MSFAMITKYGIKNLHKGFIIHISFVPYLGGNDNYLLSDCLWCWLQNGMNQWVTLLNILNKKY